MSPLSWDFTVRGFRPLRHPHPEAFQGGAFPGDETAARARYVPAVTSNGYRLIARTSIGTIRDSARPRAVFAMICRAISP